MKVALRFAHAIDRFTCGVGRVVSWLALLMILIGAYNTIVRYAGRFIGFNLSSNLYLELQWYLFSLIFLLGAAYTLRRNSHVRVDVLYGRCSERAQAWIDLVGSIAFLIPFCLFALWVTWPSVVNSWELREGSPDPGGLPRYPIKTVVLVAFAMLILQGVAEVIHNLAFLRGPKSERESGEIRI
jgi:TRAP-type mannitol/chloroaromatic compound transport system permease small subunit